MLMSSWACTELEWPTLFSCDLAALVSGASSTQDPGGIGCAAAAYRKHVFSGTAAVIEVFMDYWPLHRWWLEQEEDLRIQWWALVVEVSWLCLENPK